MFKKIIASVMAVMMSVGCLNSFAFADDYDVMPVYEYASDCTAKITISGTTATCKSEATGISGTTTKITVIQTLQKFNGNTFVSAGTWTKTYNNYSCTMTNTKSSLSSGTYRVKTYAKFYCGSDYETLTSYSSAITI